MTRALRYQTIPDRALWPSHTPGGVDAQRQAEAMQELRELSNQIARAYSERDQRLLALALSYSLSRRDMAIATGLSKSRVDQIIAESATRHDAAQNAAAQQRVRRHLRGGALAADRSGKGDAAKRSAE